MNKASWARLSAIVIVFLLFATLFPLSGSQLVSANPDRLEWSVVDTPSEEGNVVVSPSEINAFAISSNDTFYAIDIPHSKVYKSTNASVTWKNITDALIEADAELPAWDIAVAPNNPDLVAVVTDNRTAVYVWDAVEKEWVDSNVPNLGGTNISDIAISPKHDDTYDIAIGTRNPDNSTNGDVWVITLKVLGHWKAQKLQIDPDTANTTADVSTVRFSPNYAEDKAILAIASSANDVSQRKNRTFLCTGQRNIENNNTTWTPPEEFIEIIDPAESSSGDSPSQSKIIFSDLALPSGDYSKDSKWIAYASYYSNSTTRCDDVYRIEEDGKHVYRLDVKGGNEVGIASIAYQGGILLAGEVAGKKSSANALIHICSNPTEWFPKWEEPTKPPTGGASSENRANAQVMWLTSGTAYCATSTNNVTNADEWADTNVSAGHPWHGANLDESAFSKSEDGGDTWNQLSLIDTELTRLCDYAFSADNDILYLASISDGGFNSLWRTKGTDTEALTKTWQRILCLDKSSSAKDNIILRPTPEWEEKEQIYFAVPDTNDVQYSEDEGNTWEKLWDCPPVTDLAVVSDKLLYILDDYRLNKCSWNETREIWEWQTKIDTGLNSGSAVIAYGEHYVFVSEDGGKTRIAYSSDGGETFNLTKPLPQPGTIQFTLDEDFNSNKFIYAASDASLSDVYRWAIGTSTSWREMNTPSKGFHGLAQIDEVLYGAYRAGVVRTLVPHLERIRETDWDTTEAGLTSGVTFKSRSLKAISNEDIDLWAIDGENYDFSTEEGCLWVYTDAFVLETPWPNTPALGKSLPCDECTCRAEDFCFRWRMLPSTEKYDLWIALDEDFTAILHKEGDITPVAPCNPAWCPSSSSIQFICGETYFWKVRSCESTEGERIRSRWSPTMKFTVKACSAEEGEVHLAPLLLVPDIGAKNIGRSPTFSWKGFPPTTKYEFILAKDDALSQVIVNEKVPGTVYQYKGHLNWGNTYYWQVTAIDPVLSESSVGIFTVMPTPEPATPIPPTPSWIWAIIGILTFLDIIIITFCLIKR